MCRPSCWCEQLGGRLAEQRSPAARQPVDRAGALVPVPLIPPRSAAGTGPGRRPCTSHLHVRAGPAQVLAPAARTSSGSGVPPVTRVTSSPPPDSIRSSTSPGHLRQVRPDDAKSPCTTPSTSPGCTGPALVIASAVATVTAPSPGPGRRRRTSARTSSSASRSGSCTAAAASPCTWARVGQHAHPDPLRAGQRRRRLRDRRSRRWRSAAPRRVRAPVRRIPSSSSACTGPAAGSATGPPPPRPARTARQARPRRTGTRPAPSRRSGARRCGRAGTRWVIRTCVRVPGRDPGLDRRAGVVDVDVDVPQPVAADHDHASRPSRPAGAQRAAPTRRSASSRYITS